MLARRIEPGAGLAQVSAQARVAHQAKVGREVGRIEGQALPEPVSRMQAKLAVGAVTGVRVGEPAQHQGRTLPAGPIGRRGAEQLDEPQPMGLGLVGFLLQLGRQRQRPFLLGRQQWREAGPEGIEPLRRMGQQTQAHRPRHAGCQRATVAQQHVAKLERGRRGVTGPRHQIQHQCALRLRAALQIEHQRAARFVELARSGQPPGGRHQADPQGPGQRLERTFPGHTRQGLRGLLRV